MVWTWAWDGAGNEVADEVGGDEWAANVAVRGAACGAGLEAEAAPGAEGDSGGMLMGREDGFVHVQDGTVGGIWGGEVQWFVETGVKSPRDCAG